MDIGYVAVETFFPTHRYKEWSKLFHIEEVISFNTLCPRILRYIEDGYNYLPGTSWFNDIVNDLDLLLSKLQGRNDCQILAVKREPKSNCANIQMDKRFRFYGYDLIDDVRISALTNCGGFDKAFLSEDISEYGLIKEFDKAKQIQSLLLSEYPDDEHAYCSLWAIWKMEFEE
ncbi:hypothetical protein DP73_18065 [Desulfosporosinus sp. HMP52]|uniref:hypothetical protein n=1 Tax=Desulfosporosinus sp. HMP52 TaxID=1487923 RepID=UPI00051F9D6B|nr:hypothetical protein [Desulfosporosinus sp. HMP52]KGK85836.1 hypothetical protein DP73_18065 [Desulfosporosinus sp. HMP52]